MPDKKTAPQSPKPPTQTGQTVTSTPALRHVGPTLESDPNFFAVERSEGFTTPEAQLAAEGTSPETHVGRDATDVTADISGRFDSADAGAGRDNEPEPLKTRLPGDTSSDPHTDLGPDTAASLQNRPDR